MDNNSLEQAWVDSKQARDMELAKYDSDQALDILCKAKTLVMAYWQNEQFATTKQLAEYFVVPVRTLNQTRSRHADEFNSDGLLKLTRKTLKTLSFPERYNLYLSGNEASVWLWTPRASLRLAMLLTNSEVAKEVRTVMLDTVASVPQLLDRIAYLEAQLALANQKALSATICEDPRPWVKHFSDEWFSEAERVTGWKRTYRCMASFVNLAIYDHCSPEVKAELDRINPNDPKKRLSTPS